MGFGLLCSPSTGKSSNSSSSPSAVVGLCWSSGLASLGFSALVSEDAMAVGLMEGKLVGGFERGGDCVRAGVVAGGVDVGLCAMRDGACGMLWTSLVAVDGRLWPGAGRGGAGVATANCSLAGRHLP